MENKNLIPAEQFCSLHSVEISFLSSLNTYGLLQITRMGDKEFINEDQLYKLERLARLHYELDVNLEGLDVINHLLERMQQMQAEISYLKDRLRFYED
jgi:hypothetical protein